MLHRTARLLILAGGLLAATAVARAEMHNFKDWVVACDNTRACEAQGYAAEDDALGAVLVVRRAAAGAAPVRMTIGFGEIDRSTGDEAAPPPPGQPVQLKAGALNLTLPAPREGWIELTAAQAGALRAELLRAEALQLASGGRQWTVSLAGASAALLKMDDLQNRIGTQGALVRRGPVADRMVPAAPPVPVVRPMRVPAPRPDDAALRVAIAREIKPDDCERLAEPDTVAQGEVLRLDAQRVLVSLPCWLAAYQGGSGAWIASDRPPHAPRAVRFQQPEAEGDEREQPTGLSIAREADGRLTARSSAKGRGIGDCWSTRAWVWDGMRFALLDATVSPCRMFSAGGVPITLWRAKLAR